MNQVLKIDRELLCSLQEDLVQLRRENIGGVSVLLKVLRRLYFTQLVSRTMRITVSSVSALNLFSNFPDKSMSS